MLADTLAALPSGDTRRTQLDTEPKPVDCYAVIAVFDRLFSRTLNTRLMGNGLEPIYLPEDDQVAFNRIVFSYDYVASALHEVAHWCVAGVERRQQEDYGYWYAPDGRTPQQQTEFEQVEVKPQALEWILSVAAGLPFRVSADNLEAELGASDGFKDAIHQQVLDYLQAGVNERTQALVEGLADLSTVELPLSAAQFCRASL